MKRWHGWLIAGGVLVGLFATLVVVTAFLPKGADELAGSISNPRGNGTRALAQVLKANGVQVRQETTLRAAVAAAKPGTTLAVYLTQPLSESAVEWLRNVPAEVVLISAGPAVDLDELTSGAASQTWWWRADGSAPTADCTDPDALATGRITPSDYGVWAEYPEAVSCFPDDEEAGLFVRATTPSHQLTVISAGDLVHNDTITEEGNAALALRTLGKHSTLTWYLPGGETSGEAIAGQPSQWVLLPGWAGAVFAALLVAGAAAALWRGRRFGPLVREQLPVAVPASEVSTELGRLYRQASARGHAAAGLRAATLSRLSPRLGLTAGASPELVIQRLTEASGESSDLLGHLFYGPAPTTDAELVTLTSRLTDLERKLTV